METREGRVPERFGARAAVAALAAALALTACGARVAGTSPAAASPSPRLPLCSPAAADYAKPGAPTPSPCVSIDPNRRFADDARHRDRRDPRPADVAAVRGAAADLDRALQAERRRGQFDEASTRQAIAGYPTLARALVYRPTVADVLITPGATVVVVVVHGSACVIGEHGPPSTAVHVVGLTLDGGCRAMNGH